MACEQCGNEEEHGECDKGKILCEECYKKRDKAKDRQRNRLKGRAKN